VAFSLWAQTLAIAVFVSRRKITKNVKREKRERKSERAKGRARHKNRNKQKQKLNKRHEERKKRKTQEHQLEPNTSSQNFSVPNSALIFGNESCMHSSCFHRWLLALLSTFPQSTLPLFLVNCGGEQLCRSLMD
jgi:Flp pilus assembly protein TadB